MLGFVNLPIVAYFFAPFAAFDFQWGAMLFFVTGLAMVMGTWLLLVRLAGLGINERWMLLLLIAANGPLHYSLKEGNTAHMGLFALALGLYFLRSGRDIAAGAVLSIGALLKLPLLLPFSSFPVLLLPSLPLLSPPSPPPPPLFSSPSWPWRLTRNEGLGPQKLVSRRPPTGALFGPTFLGGT